MENNVILVSGKKIQVKGTTETYVKQAILDVALAEAIQDNGMISRLIYDSVVYALIVNYYTDLDFDGNKKIVEIFDELEKQGIISQVIKKIGELGGEEEIKNFLEYADAYYSQAIQKINSASTSIEHLIKLLITAGATSLADINNE